MVKSFLKSKTLGANAIALVIAVLSGQFGVVPISGDVLAAMMAVLNIILRFITKQPISVSGH